MLRPEAYDWSVHTEKNGERRPDVDAAERGGDIHQGMVGEAEIDTSSLEQAAFWRQVYAEILAMEEKVMARVVELMSAESPEVRREVELSNVPVIAAQVDRFRQRRDFWSARVKELDDRGGDTEPASG